MQTFDGAGNVEAFEMLTAGGATVPSHLRGTYQLGSDCTGTMTTVFDNGMTGQLWFVVAGDQIYAIETDPGVLLTLVFNRM